MLLSWRMWPVYLLLAAAWTVPSRFRWTRTLLLTLLAGASLGAWVMVPVPVLTLPDGPYRVGTSIFRWVDESRPEEVTADPADHRNVIVQAFYPVAEKAAGTPSIYMDGLQNLPPRVSVLPRFLLQDVGRTDTHSMTGVPVGEQRAHWPVIVFSPGFGATRSFYTSLITGLASRGVVVLAIDHPYEAGVVELANGQVVTTVIQRRPDEPDLIGYMTRQQDLRVADIRFALDRIPILPFAAHLDLDRVAAIGHSFGGASSIAAMARDRRIRLAVNIDGTPYGALPEARLDRPVMWLQSDLSESRYSPAYLAGNTRILNGLQGAPGYRFQAKHVNHFGFTDFPCFLSTPGRWLLSLAMGGSRDPQSIHRATVDLVMAFLDKPDSLRQVASRYEWISGGRVK
ncbi:alpha/beta fold hydrolase [uncultured Paludibaculum sp.]|uniref:alpha/beta hydrolase family protein n=1 Tax=uncultured Paludibaculum sp. TaxID=1765020 RepID=UPI002AAC08F2|nr:alpha/beta fold hydrolase [uncultured Paludibaculum sp.]